MVDLPADRLRIAAARADFLDSPETGAAGVPEVVAASWQRSHSAGVESSAYVVAYHHDLDVDTRLARCARPVLEWLAEDMRSVPVSIALADSKARIIDRRDCSNAVGRLLDRVSFNPGFSFEEAGIGTNGIGTVFEAGQPVSVVGSAHFNEALTPFACTGAPVIDPLTGRLEGVLDVSLLAETWNPLIYAMVKTAANDIGRNLMLDRSRALQALFESYVKVDARTHLAVVAVGDTIILNQRAQRLLSPKDQIVVQQHARFLIARPSIRSDNVRLPDGRTLYIRVSRVEADGETTGVVLLVADEPHPGGRSAPEEEPGLRTLRQFSDDLPEHQATGFDEPWLMSSTSAAWNQAACSLREAFQRGESVLVRGERGSGRSQLISDVFSRAIPEGHLVVSANGRLATEGSRAHTMFVVQDLEMLDSEEAAGLVAQLQSLSEPYQLCVTMGGRIDDEHPASGLLDDLTTCVTIPAVRHRAGDIPKLAADLLIELAPTRKIRLAPQTERVLAAYPWPGNLTQMRAALREAMMRRPVGEIQAEDVPGYCRSASLRQVSALEVAERDAIVEALRTHGGNRVQAAAALGMARSSLYRKLKYYAITDV